MSSLNTSSISLICSTYNSPHFLEIVLDSLLYQTYKNFELIIADDGSTEETKILIDSFREKAGFPIHHLWHEDKGWRKSLLHNKAINKSKGDLLVFIDGDCVLAPRFIQDHWETYQKYKRRYVLMGRRVELGSELTNQMTRKNYRSFLFSPLPWKLIKSGLQGDTKNTWRFLRFSNPLLRKVFKADNVMDLLGCNFSLPRQELEEINGFNLEMDRWCRGEDGDIFVRLRNNGVVTLGRKYFANMFHMYHGRSDSTEVDKVYEELLVLRDYRYCDKGLKETLT